MIEKPLVRLPPVLPCRSTPGVGKIGETSYSKLTAEIHKCKVIEMVGKRALLLAGAGAIDQINLQA